MPGAYKILSDDIFTAMATVAGSAIATVSDLGHAATESGRQVKMLEITGPGDASGRPVALVVGGQHAREWAPPDAVFSFAKNLVDAYDSGGDINYPATRIHGVDYAAWTISNKVVKDIVEDLVLLVIPVVNPDGRDHSLNRAAVGDMAGRGWRGNRNSVACAAHGVDLNRNYDIAWDPNPLPAGGRAYYSDADRVQIESDGGYNPACTSQTYRGPGPGSESEVKNVQEVIDSRKVGLFIDVHAHGRWVLVPWGIAGTQTTDASKTFLNTALDRTTAGGAGRTVTDRTYEEYLQDSSPRLFETHEQVSAAMKRAIVEQAGPEGSEARTRSEYTIVRIAEFYMNIFGVPNLVPIPGSSTDYALARQFKPGETKPAHAFALECGSRLHGEGGFYPSVAVYEKVEREVHAALLAMLKAALPKCVLATAAYGSPSHPRVERLRHIRDEELAGSALGAGVVGMLNRTYYAVSPPLARTVSRRRRARVFVRTVVVNPAYGLLTALSAATRGLPDRRLRSLVMLAGLAATVALAGAGITWLLRGLIGG